MSHGPETTWIERLKAALEVNKKLVHLGRFSSLSAAITARAEAKHKHHTIREADGHEA